MPLRRISITIPDELVRLADERARELDRSRSWIVVDALRQYLDSPVRAPLRQVAESSLGYVRVDRLGEQRRLQLEADLALTPEERVVEAERTAKLTEKPGSSPSNRVMTFDRYEDYLEWDSRESLRP